jgi:hypothetical protein
MCRRGVESRLVIEDDRGGSGTSGLDPVVCQNSNDAYAARA